MIDRDHKLTVTRQCELLKLARSTAYYTPLPTPEEELALMRLIDELHLKHPFAGARMLRDLLRALGHQVGRRRVRRLMDKIGIEALYPKPNTSRKAPGSQIYPYLLRDLTVDRPNQVFASDITYIPMRRGFLYLVVVLDWYSRKVLSWRLSNTMTSDFCVDALQEAIRIHGAPEIFNTDQGSQFTSSDFTGALKEHGIQISMDGKGRWVDNVFVERLWRSVKYEHVYLHAFDTVRDAKAGIGAYLRFYNTTRPHQALGGQTPDAVYFGSLSQEQLAA
jgi:putative transposase